MTANRLLVAFEERLKHCPRILTLGVRPNFDDYSEREKDLIRRAEKIYYPSAFYAELLDTIGRPIFPSYQTYRYAQDKIKQTALFQLAGIPHPRTRVFYGERQKDTIQRYFPLPVIAKVPRGSAMGRGVFLIRTPKALARYCQSNKTAYIQEYLPIDRDMRLVVIGKKVVHAYWRVSPVGDYRSNVSLGGEIDLSPVPRGAIELALETALTCGWDDVGIDICHHKGGFYVLEANMKYGKEGFRKAGIDYLQMLEQMISRAEI